jgi:acetyl-CoA acetyltransferase
MDVRRKDSSCVTETFSMLMTKEKRPAIRTLHGWAISVLQEAGAIRECETHGWMQDPADPHARQRAFVIARLDPPAGVSLDAVVAEVRDVLDSIGDICPECLPD